MKFKFALSCVVLSMLSACGSDNDNRHPPVSGEATYVFAVLPDTQKYARYTPERFVAQTQWIADNYQQHNIVFTMHLGDVVDQAREEIEWQHAKDAMMLLQSNPQTPYSILAGNHDVMAYHNGGIDSDYDDGRESHEPFLKHFPVSLQDDFPSFGGADPTGFNTWHLVQGGERQYLVMALDWRVSDATLAWAKTVLASHSDVPTILTTHQLLNVDSDGETAIFTDHGSRLWQELIASHDQIFLTFNGHHHGEAKMTAKNNFGRDVHLILTDYQSGFWGGNGMMQTVTFDEDNDSLRFRSFSPWVEAIPEADRLPQDEAERWVFELPLDFDSRFENLNQGSHEQLEGNIEGTLAYWRFDDSGKVTAPGALGDVVFKDLSGNGNNLALTMKPGTDDTRPLKDFVSFEQQAPDYGYADGFIRFNGGKVQGGYYLQSRAPVSRVADHNAGVLPQYTVEMVVRVGDNWTPQNNAWASVFSHQPSTTEVCQFHQLSCRGGDQSVGLNTSSLNEFQWLGLARNGVNVSHWSWEVDKAHWYHIAVVNDGNVSTLYVDGSLVMRTAEKAQPGLLTIPGQPWNIGAASWDGEISTLFSGDIAEIRVHGQALPRELWLL
ncbi:LamG-like jellyroll fold domain-containing protein [Shewanella sp. GXUN23E]|uniref:LamG-like jellyroll fold domain-containing protein n=1 Tax=Shewanella sp. GXUN23E TaxID=3422498 RepID=UPI003D7CD327